MGIRKGYQSNLEANIEPNGLNEVELKWSSSNEAVAEVNIYGGITGKAEGEAVITVEALDGSGVKATCQVIVGELVTTIEKTSHETIKAIDELGNTVTVPGGFKIAEDSGGTVKEGIVIEDSDGNQFVWIPVSNIDGSNNNPIWIDDENSTVITLGRYTFNAASGKETKVQYGSEYAKTSLAAVTEVIETGSGEALSYREGSYYYELTDARESNGLVNLTGTNSTAKDLAGFISSVESNKGYYIGRYEASYESGDAFGDATTSTNYKMASKVSDPNATSTGAWSNTKGRVWNYITQGNAVKVARNMYNSADSESKYVESDLLNSYMWDTAIVYIQAMGNSNYANRKDANGTLYNTGGTEDQVCKIYDMGGNLREWTTEYSSYSYTNYAYPCTFRGGNYYTSNLFTSTRFNSYATGSDNYLGFRSGLYCIPVS